MTKSSKIGRLIQTIILLGTKNYMTAEELASAFHVKVRTTYRDIKELNSWGFKINSSSGTGGGYSISSNFKIDFSNLTEDELEALTSILNIIPSFSDLGNDDFNLETITSKLSSKLNISNKALIKKHLDSFYFDQSRWYKKYKHSDHLKNIKESILQQHEVNIYYIGSNKTLVPENIYPYGLVYKSDTWYMVGYSSFNSRIKRWNVTRIKTLEKTALEFIRPENFKLKEWWIKEIEEFGKGDTRVIISIMKRSLSRFDRFQWKENNVFYEHGDRVIIELFVDNYDWLIDIVLINRGEVNVIEPQELKDKILNIASEINLNHSDLGLPDNLEKKQITLFDLEALSLLDNSDI